MTVVAVTGASGYVGRRVLEALEEQSDVRRVIGIDVVDPPFSTRNLEFYRIDIRSPDVGRVLQGADVLIHLAFAFRPLREPAEMRDINVGGTRTVFAAAADAGVRKLVHVSSALAYGAHPDNDVPLSEESPLRPVQEFPYSAQKGECEEIVLGFREAHPEIAVTVLRSALVLGPTVSGLAARLVEAPLWAAVTGYEPGVQVVHETDVARAVAFAVEHDLDGAYNLCCDGWVEQDRAAGLLGQRYAAGSLEVVRRWLDAVWMTGLSSLPPSTLPFRMYPWVMSNEKLRSAGFAFVHGNESTLLEAAEARRGWTSLGRVRFRQQHVLLAAGAILAGRSLVGRLWSARRPGA